MDPFTIKAPHIAPSCIPPLVYDTASGSCRCPDGFPPTGTPEQPICLPHTPAPPAPVNCAVTVVYDAAAPQNVAWSPIKNNPACDQAGLELALAVLVARLLGAP